MLTNPSARTNFCEIPLPGSFSGRSTGKDLSLRLRLSSQRRIHTLPPRLPSQIPPTIRSTADPHDASKGRIHTLPPLAAALPGSYSPSACGCPPRSLPPLCGCPPRDGSTPLHLLAEGGGSGRRRRRRSRVVGTHPLKLNLESFSPPSPLACARGTPSIRLRLWRERCMWLRLWRESGNPSGCLRGLRPRCSAAASPLKGERERLRRSLRVASQLDLVARLRR